MASPKKDTKSKVNDSPAKKSGVFDVARPGSGQVATSTTSKPVIVSNRPVMQDPMMVNADNNNESVKEVPDTAPVLTPTKKKVIMPLGDIKPTDNQADAPEPEVAPIEESKKVEETPEKASKETPEEEPVVKTESGEQVTVLEPAQKAGVPAKEREEKELTPDQVLAAEKSAEERQVKLQKMVEDEQYFLPINAAQERRSRLVAIIGLIVIVLLALAWYNVALDAGLLPNQFNVPHTGFFTIE